MDHEHKKAMTARKKSENPEDKLLSAKQIKMQFGLNDYYLRKLLACQHDPIAQQKLF